MVEGKDKDAGKQVRSFYKLGLQMALGLKRIWRVIRVKEAEEAP